MLTACVNYYDLNAQKYVDTTIDVAISEQLEYFCSKLSKNATILDVGCGSGRDSLAFLKKGFNVVAIDASVELSKIASKIINQDVLVKDILTLDINNNFDAVWAMASLLHLKKEELPIAIHNCVKSLKTDGDGLFFMSLKIGNGENYDENGRFFSYYQKDEIIKIMNNSGYFESIDININEDKLGRGNTSWISLLAKKTLSLDLTKPIKNRI